MSPSARNGPRLLIALLLVEPVLGPGQVLRPIVQVEIPPPGLGRPAPRRPAGPGRSPRFPMAALPVGTLRLPRCGPAPHHAAPYPEMPCRGPVFRPLGP